MAVDAETEVGGVGYEENETRGGLGAVALAWLIAGVVAAVTVGFVAGRLTAPERASGGTVSVTAPPTGGATSAGGGTTVTSSASPRTALDDALALHAAGKLDEATKAYRAILAEDSANKYAHYNLGQIAQQRSAAAEATAEYEATLKLDPNYGPALYNLSLLKADVGDRDGAIALLRTAVAADPNSARSALALGKLLVAAGSADEGAALIAKAVALDPSLKP